MNYKADEFDYEAEYQRLRKGVARANILLLGASGAGKSSVINHVFGREMTQAGPGQSVTRGVIPCSSDDMPVVLYDTEGYTAGSAGMDAFERNVLAFADRLAADLHREGAPVEPARQVLRRVKGEDDLLEAVLLQRERLRRLGVVDVAVVRLGDARVVD